MDKISTPYRFNHDLTLDKPFRAYHYQSPGRVTHSERPDIHYSLHLGILLDGRFMANYSGYEYETVAGDVWFTAPWEPHLARYVGYKTDILLFVVLPERLGDVGLPRRLPWLSPFLSPVPKRPYPKSDADRAKILEIARQVVLYLDTNSRNEEVMCWLKLHELLSILITETDFQQKGESDETAFIYERVLPAVELVKGGNRTGTTLSEAASACGLGRSRFGDLFKKAMGIPFGAFASRARIGGAANEIKTGRKTIKEIADDWGFFDESHFYRTFRRHFHCAPSEFLGNDNLESIN